MFCIFYQGVEVMELRTTEQLGKFSLVLLFSAGLFHTNLCAIIKKKERKKLDYGN